MTKNLTGTGSSQAVVLTAGDLTTLTDGTIGVSATQTDAVGNAQTAAANTTSFVLDTAAPAAATGAGHGGIQRGDGGGGGQGSGVVTVSGEAATRLW